MTYITVNNKIFERLEDAQEYERCVSVAMQKTITIRVLMARTSDLRARRDALEKELAALDIAEDAAYVECRKADTETQEAGKKAIGHPADNVRTSTLQARAALHLYGQWPKEQG
jgi:hypothetical protein